LAGASLVFEDDVQSVNQTGNPTEQGQRDVDEQVNTTAALEEDTQRGQDNGKDNLADVGSGERHGGGFSRCDQTVLIRRGLIEVRSRMSYR
jgi:hypothetical protein